MAELAAGLGLAVPPDLAFFPGMGLQAALSRFAFTLSLLRNRAAVARVAAEICEDASREGVSTLEIRFAPQLHGEDPAAFVDAALEGIAGRAGLLLCGLYGEPPALLQRLVEIGRGRPGVVGIDLAGGPAPDHRYGLLDYADAFAAAGRAGLGRTAHVGEGRPPVEIALAIERLGVERIGHGTTLIEDPAVHRLVVESQITVEACLSSNWQVGAIPSILAHPLPRWLASGVRATICTDNTLLSAVDAPSEHYRAATLPGMTAASLEAAIGFGHAAAFGPR